MVIAIDGPSGVGKSTVSRAVATRLGMAYLDTGATYRACALACMRDGVNLSRADDVAAVAQTMNVTMVTDPSDPRVLLDGEDVSRELRGEAVTMAVSDVATNLEARAILGDWQRELIAAERTGGFSQGGGVVAEGRDITTVIAPKAELRILMTADPEAIRAGVLGRDAKDSSVVNFHTAADGVITVDTTHLTVDEVVDAIVAMAHEAAL